MLQMPRRGWLFGGGLPEVLALRTDALREVAMSSTNVSGEDQPDPRLYEVAAELAYPGIVQDRHEDRARILLMRADAADRAAGIRRVTAKQITAHLRDEQERLGWCSGDNEHWHGGMHSAADAVREFFEGGTES